MVEISIDKKIEARVIKIIKKVMLDEDLEISLDIDLVHDLGMDSLETTEMLMRIEEVFNIDVLFEDFEDFEKLDTLEQIINLIKSKF